MWVYQRSEHNVWTVGFYAMDHWHTDSDHDSAGEAARRCNYLNGGYGQVYPLRSRDEL